MPRKKKEPVTDNEIEVLIKKKSQKKKIKEKILPKIEYIAPEYTAPEFKEPDTLYKYSDKIPRHPSRLNVYNKFFTLLQLHSNWETSKLQAMALNIEKSIFNYTLISSVSKDWDIMFQNRYISCSVRVYSNLNPNSILKNTNLIKRLFNNEINEFDIVQLSPEEIFPERHQELVDIILANTAKVAPKIEVKDMPDGAFRCKCKSWKTTYVEYQSRSADEPTSKRVKCLSCGHVWKFC